MMLEEFDAVLRTFHSRRPFHAFTVVLLNGDRVVITRPEDLGFRGGVAAYLGPKYKAAIFDHRGVTESIGGPRISPELSN